MSPGVMAQIKEQWRYCYRAHGTPIAGVVQEVSPSGQVARIRLDQIADSFVLVAHLEPVSVAAEIEESLLSAG